MTLDNSKLERKWKRRSLMKLLCWHIRRDWGKLRNYFSRYRVPGEVRAGHSPKQVRSVTFWATWLN